MRRRIRAAALPLHRRSVPQLAVDGLLVAFAYYLAFQLRFEGGAKDRYNILLERTIWWVFIAAVISLALARVHQRRWRYAGQRDYEAILRAVVAIVLVIYVAVAVLRPYQIATPSRTVAYVLPSGVVVLFFLLSLVFLCGLRILVRGIYDGRLVPALHSPAKSGRTVLIVGAGDGGSLVLREIMRNRELGLVPVGFLDDDPRKHGLRIEGVRVRGNTQSDLPRILDDAEPDEVIIAIPSAPGYMRGRVVRECRARQIPVRTLPTVFELLRGRGGLAMQVREVRVEDVLGREPVIAELDRVGSYLQGETVLVTGAGGSIGAELCRQIVRVGPRRIILLDHAENNLFSIVRELEDEDGLVKVPLQPVLGDCKQEERMREVLTEHRPTVVFHAAAYKHVGLMETNPIEAVRNNALATRLMARLAGELDVRRFVLVSTDKAVEPATVMGASKALAELALEGACVRYPSTRYNAVRFGNVLGSSGSVIPIFRRQITRGGPVTVTDERMTRYFMTIPEAVQLIIRSGSLATPGAAGVFVLDMGEPVRIIDLARAMIELSGLRPGQDVEIEIVGRRPGEKLQEQLFNAGEVPRPTAAEKILLAQRDPLPPQEIEAIFAEVELLVAVGDTAALAPRVCQLVCGTRGPVISVEGGGQSKGTLPGADRADGHPAGSRGIDALLRSRDS
jgi:FlaA1/EpsC-like NDP-sugar epimerase